MSHGATIKNDERYEVLWGDGYSKEAAPHIASAGHPDAGPKGGAAEPYEEWTFATCTANPKSRRLTVVRR